MTANTHRDSSTWQRPARRLARLLTSMFFALALIGLGACGSMEAMDGSPGTNAEVASKQSASYDSSSHGGYNSGADAGSTSAGPGGQSGGGSANPADSDEGIGFKPGGAQDINYFRQLVAQGEIPAPTDMTLEGWLNEKDTKLPKANPDRTIDMHALAGILQGPGQDKPEAVIQLGFNSSKSLAKVQAKVALTLVIDRSGSMKGNKIAYVKQGLHALLDSLPAGTRLSLVSFSTGATTDWGPKVFDANSHKKEVGTAIDKLVASGGTNLHQGLKVGAEHCLSAGEEYTFRRVILLSDGQPTSGLTSFSAIVGLAKQMKDKGVSISTVGVGNGFNPTLMTTIAQKGDGTAWFLKNAAHAKDVFLNDLETLLLPVAKDLWITFKLAEGWKVDKIYGFDWVEEDGEITITGPSSGQPVGPTPEDPDNKGEPTTGEKDKDGNKAALPTLFASKKNGMIMVRLIAPDGAEQKLVDGLLLSTIQYGYTIAKVETKESFEVPVNVPGITMVPDGGFAYFADPIVRRSFALLRAGLALVDAATAAGDGKKDDGIAALDAALNTLDAQAKKVPEAYDPAPGLADAVALLTELKELLKKQP